MSGAQFLSRRILRAIALRLLNRRFAFAIAAAATLSAKSVHIYAHLDALSMEDILLWGLSFFSQDTAFLLVIRMLLDRCLDIILSGVVTFTVLFLFFAAAVSISFFFTTGTELQWRNVALVSDSSSWRTLSSGWISCLLAFVALLAIAGILQLPFDRASSIALDILRWPVSLMSNKLPVLNHCGLSKTKYKHLSQQDVEYIEEAYKDGEFEDRRTQDDAASQLTKCTSILRLLIGTVLVAQAICTVARPTNHSLIFMSWTLPLMPFVDLMLSTPSLANLLAISGNANNTLENCTALSDPIPWAWIPNNVSLQGFEDWHETDKEHYLASNDPLKLSNLDDDLLLPLRGNLKDAPIRHVLLIKLESTRKDVFPIKKGGYIWDRLVQSFKNSSLPTKARKRLSSLTTTAKYLTGDFSDGFGQEPGTPRGGINANNVFTTSTYTLKSLVGTHCGISPLAADFNVDADHHIYQPCLPQIFEALNQLDHNGDETPNEHFTSFKWRTAFMQSVTLRYDKQDRLMPKIGFTEPLGWWELKDEAAKLGPVNLTDVNYYGMPEIAIEDYLRDVFASAKKNNERVFLSHLTSSTHHDFGIPEDEEYVPLAGDADHDDLSRYLNAVGYVDRWLSKIIKILEEEGIANETLLVAVGDHGLSIAERGTITPYSNPHVANYHVPLIMSHPKLPHININDAVSSIQILPTILDLLLETKSLSRSEARAVHDMIRNYEGQSLLRPLQKFSNINGQGGWQYTVMNPGGSTIAVRDARQPNWRLIVPVFGNYEWRFTDLETDPHEQTPLVSYDYRAILRSVQAEFGPNAATWVEEAAAVTRWWTDENYKRWRYTA